MYSLTIRSWTPRPRLGWVLALLLTGALVLPCACSGRSKADKLHAEGVILAKNRQYYKAVGKFEEALKLQRQRPDTLVECADIHLKTEKFEQAVRYAEEALALDPQNANAYLILGEAHLALARKPPATLDGDPQVDPAELAKALETVGKLRRMKPDAVEGLLLQARIDQVNGSPDSAQRLYRNVLDQSGGKNIAALLGISEVLLAEKDFKEAEAMARQAMALEKPFSPAALNNLALSLAFQGHYDAAYEALAPYLSGTNKQPEVTHYLLAGRILLTQIDALNNDRATSAGQGSGGATPEGRTRAIQRLADLGRAMKGFFPALPESFFYRAVSYQLQNDVPNAIHHFEEACTKAPQERRFRMALALAQMQNKNYAAARQELRTLMKASPGDAEARLRLAQCYALEGSHDEALDLLRNLVVDQPGDRAIKEALAKVLVLTSEPEKVKEGMDLLAEINGAQSLSPARRQVILAEAALNEGEKLAAAGQIKESDAQLLEAEGLLREAARLEPKNPFPELKLSELAVRRGDLLSGLRHARNAARLDLQFAPLEARFYVQLGQMDAARARYASLLQGNPDALGYQLAIADIDVQLGRAEEARKAFEAMIGKHRSDPRPYLHRALLLGRAEDVDAAATFLKKHLSDRPDSLTLHLGLAQVLIKARRHAEAADVLGTVAGSLERRLTAIRGQKGSEAAVIEAAGLLAQLDLKRALCELLAGKAAVAAIHADEAGEKAPTLVLPSALLQAVAALFENNPVRARSLMDGLGPKPESVPAAWPLVRALALAQGGDVAAAVAAVNDQSSIQPGTRQLLTGLLQKTDAGKLRRSCANLALLVALTQYADFAASVGPLAAEVLKVFPDDPFVLSIQADTFQAAGDLEAAAKAYDALQRVAPDYAPVLFARADLHMLLAGQAQTQGRPDEAQRQFGLATAACRAYLEKVPRDALACEKLATILQLTGQKTEAAKLYRRAIEIDPARWSAYNNLAWNLAEANQLDEAALMAEKALAASPTDGGVLDTLGWIELKREKVDRAVDLLGQAALRLPNNPDVRLHRAQALARKGDTARALAEAEGIALATPQYPHLGEVKELIRQLNPHSEVLNHSEDGSLPKADGAGPL